MADDVNYMYGNFSSSMEQFFSSKAGGRKAFASNIEIQLSSNNNGGPVIMLENPADSDQDINLSRIVVSTEDHCKWRRRRSTTVGININRGTALTAVNRGGGVNVPKGKVYNLVGKTLADTGFEKSVFIPGNTVYNVVEDGCIILRPGQNLIWFCTYQAVILKGAPIVCFEIVWWETPKAAN
jgi:hypothetical protein